MRLSDHMLVVNLIRQANHKTADWEFLRLGKSWHSIQEMGKRINSPADQLGLLPREVLTNLWTGILTDAINVLKWRDSREKPEAGPGYGAWIEDTFGHLAFGIEDLKKYFEEFIDFERLLYGAERYYRDHFLHVIRVWLTGVLVMTDDRCLPEANLRLDVPKEAQLEFSVSERLAMWSVIALCHDLGYPLEKISSVNKPLRDMLSAIGKAQVQDLTYSFPPQHQFIDNFIIQFISSKLVLKTCRKSDGDADDATAFKTRIQPKYYLKFSKSFEDLKHGILSCTLLMKRLVYFLESDFDMGEDNILEDEDARQFLIRREMLRAIATHTCHEIYHLYCTTYSFLLIVCDELQTWSRPTLGEMRGQPSYACGVVLNRYNSKSVKATLSFKSKSHTLEALMDDMQPFVKETFQRLHKILRSAVYVGDRKFGCTWTIRLQAKGGRREFRFEHNKDNKSRVVVDGQENKDWLYGPV